MASDFEGLYDEIREELGKATKLTKKIWLTCKSCNKRSLVDVPDVKSLLDTLTFLSDRAIGRPGVAEADAAGEQWTFENRVVLVANPDEDIDWEDEEIGRRSPVVADDLSDKA
jgi:hypothetical protein